MSLLVVNADDAGFAASTDDAILRCARAGIVRSATVAVNGATAEAFIPRGLDAGLDLGLHLNLTQGFALAGPHSTLTDDTGRFCHGKAELWRRAAEGKLAPGEIRAELHAQWERLCGWDTQPSHIDGHNHVHLFPAARAALKELPASLWIRSSDAAAPPFPPELARWAAGRGPGRRTDRFCGYAFSDEPSVEGFLAALDPAAAVTEFMVHPGAREGSAFTSSALREREAEILCSSKLRLELDRRGYRMGGFPCA